MNDASPPVAPSRPPPEGTRILIVDDSRTQRLVLGRLLHREGYQIAEAANGAEALAMLEAEPISLVLSDWMMPELSGPELCRALRDGRPLAADYVYVMLLTAKTESGELAEGLRSGADDFLCKPVDPVELAARLAVGQRMVALHSRVLAEQRALDQALGELRTTQAALDRDLSLAGVLQRESAPPTMVSMEGARIAALYRPSGHVGGDLIGHFTDGAGGLGVYSIDVSGHGVASALRAAHLAQLFAHSVRTENIALERDRTGRLTIRNPAAVVAELNRRFSASDQHELYFTMALLALDLASGSGLCCGAGHSSPILLRADGRAETLSNGGPPVGLLSGIAFSAQPFRLDPGDRLLLYSDGLSEAPLGDGKMVETAGLERILSGLANTPVEEVLGALEGQVQTAMGPARFDDDVSALLIERPAEAESPASQSPASAA